MHDTPEPNEQDDRATNLETNHFRLNLDHFLALFPDSLLGSKQIAASERVDTSSVPEPYRTLLVHEHHMTVTLEKHHGRPAYLHVRNILRQGETYARKLLLTAGSDGPVIMAGVVFVRLGYLEPEVREALLQAETPLGRILIENGVMRRIQLISTFRFDLSTGLGSLFGCPNAGHTYGRLAKIFVDEKEAIELLEIVAPEEIDSK